MIKKSKKNFIKYKKQKKQLKNTQQTKVLTPVLNKTLAKYPIDNDNKKQRKISF